jgi:sugar transferase (PEP-CTERM system associated)
MNPKAGTSLTAMIRIFRVFLPTTAVALLISETLLIVAAFLLALHFEVPGGLTIYLFYDGGLTRLVIVVFSVLTGLYLYDLYADIAVRSKVMLAQQLCLVIGVAFVIQAILHYLNRDLRMKLPVMLLGSLFCLVGCFLWRLFFAQFVIRLVGRERLLLLGNSPLLAEIAEHVQAHPEHGLEVIGLLDDVEPTPPLPSVQYLGSLETLRKVIDTTHPSRIVVGMFERRNRVPVGELLELRFAGYVIEEAATTFERVCGRISVQNLRPSQLIYSSELRPQQKTLAYQSIANVLLAATGIVVASPLMLLTALAVRLSSAGPVLYRQTRIGMDNVSFTLYKFRSMRVDAEAGTGAVWASKDDPRVTTVGRIIRKIRFDELPQLINVLKGDMTIVGPRPERPEFVKVLSRQIPYYRQRHCVPPGITGWAQINYKYGDTIEDTITKLEYDMYYIKNMSFSMDCYILFHTVKAMLLSRGAQ